MKTYQYKGFTTAGQACRGLVEALSVKEAREKLAAEGVLAERVSLTGRTVRFPAERRAVVYHELSALLDAGMPLLSALNILVDSPELRSSRVLLAGVRDGVREGASLAGALREASAAVTPFEEAIIEAAERSATVGGMLANLAEFLEEQQRLRERIQAALLYPAIVFAVGICVAVLMLGLLLPRASAILADSDAGMPALTVFMIGLGRFLQHWGVAIVLLLVVGIHLVWRRVRREAGWRARWSQALFRTPVVGSGWTTLVNLRFARTMAILLQGGVPIMDALRLAGRATGNGWVAGQAEIEADAVRHGSSLSDAVRRIPPLAHSLAGWIQVGEAGGGLARLLEAAARRYQAQWDRFLVRCLALLEPLLIFAIGGFVLLVTLSVLLPVVSLSQAVGR